MKVISIAPRGYCKGVVKAVNAVKNAFNDPSVVKPIYILGYIVHNKYVIEELNDMGIITLDDRFKSRIELIDDIEEGTVVLSAHGTNPKVKQKLIEKNIPFIDATCEDVETTFSLIKEYSNKGYYIFYIGKHNHPEAIAAISLSNNISLIEVSNDIPNDIKMPIFVTNQTTFSKFEIKDLIDKIIKQYPNTVVSEEICNATSLRQSAIIKYNKGVDLCYIVGDPRSNNTRNLAIISETITKTKTIQIETVKDISSKDLENVKVVSVSSGASTPNHLTQEVIDYLKNYRT
ncbi:MAG: 4-hydroxy-3-methylbut-2-enyl diphosphate reductase [Tenericutes bacterium 4572_104]|nr:MAG: 4-hydroxy-3-methylbut-2-enyl diphosphate reductase [Tenericutes bacterium 4572_104]